MVFRPSFSQGSGAEKPGNHFTEICRKDRGAPAKERRRPHCNIDVRPDQTPGDIDQENRR